MNEKIYAFNNGRQKNFCKVSFFARRIWALASLVRQIFLLYFTLTITIVFDSLLSNYFTTI
jgi:hypothetical protein